MERQLPYLKVNLKIDYMLIETLKFLFNRDLNRLRNEIESYKNEENLWKVEKLISNSAGNLCLHLAGNLNHFVGATLGQTGYIRNRENEFAQKNVPKNELLKSIRTTREMVKAVLQNLDENDLEKDFPIEVQGKKMTTIFFLIHLATHLNYHLGQINYHRRILA